MLASAAFLIFGPFSLASAEPFDRINPTECVKTAEEAKIVELAKDLNDSSACSASNACKYKARETLHTVCTLFQEPMQLTHMHLHPACGW
jgi:hypothetical protein